MVRCTATMLADFCSRDRSPPINQFSRGRSPPTHFSRDPMLRPGRRAQLCYTAGNMWSSHSTIAYVGHLGHLDGLDRHTVVCPSNASVNQGVSHQWL